jgi:mannitol 2-dehydrogenase
MTALSAATLASLEPAVAVPGYDRSAVTVGIVHIGVGGFHRAHQAMYLDELMNAGRALDWGIGGVGVMAADRRMQQVMAEQDCLYTLVVKSPDGSQEPRVIGSIVEYLFAPDDPDAVVERMASEQVRIVSLTVTEGGYNFHHVTGEFDAQNPDVQHDLVEPAAPRTSFGLVVEALVRRRERGLPAFTVMSCDNIEGNGDVARRMFTAYATRSWGPGCRPRSGSRTRWWTGSRRPPPTRTGPSSASGSAWTTAGRWSASRSPNGPWRTRSVRAGRRSRTSASRWWATSNPTS